MSEIQPVDELPIANLGPLTVAGASTWEAITELATLIPLDRWTIVGGQMVAIHAALAGVEPPRVRHFGDAEAQQSEHSYANIDWRSAMNRPDSVVHTFDP